MTQSISSTDFKAKIEGDVSGQIIIGNHNIQINADNGSHVSLKVPGEQAIPRATPVMLLPPKFHGLLDRKVELNVAVNALKSYLPVEFYGEQGAGKSSLLRRLAYLSDDLSFTDGVVHFSAAGLTASDLSNELFKVFYEVGTDRSFKPTVVELLHLMKEKRGLILLDDVILTRDELQRVMGCAPACTFVVASQARLLWGEGQPLEIKGLPIGDAVTLFEREFGRALSDDERAAAESLCSRLKGHPQSILDAAALVNKEGKSIAEAAGQLPATASGKRLLDLLTAQDRYVLGAIAALDTASVHANHLTAICGPENVEEMLRKMEQLGLAQAQHSRYSVRSDVAEALEASDLTPWRERWLAYFIAWAERNKRAHNLLLEEAIAIQSVLKWAVGAGRWEEVIRLTRAVESALILGGRWDAWEQTLQWMLKAARALGRSAAIGFALHQLGTRALGLEQKDIAKSYLEQALELRESLGDEAGAAVTRNNLEVLLKPVPVIRPKRGKGSKGAMRFFKWALLPVALFVAGYFIFKPDTPKPLSFSPSSLSFSDQSVGTVSQPQAVTISNNGSKEQRISRIAITGNNTEEFRIVDDRCSRGPIAPNSSCTVSVVFVPIAAGNRTATLVFTESGVDAQQSVLLSGTGIIRPIENASVNVSPESLSFLAKAGSESEPQTLTVANAGESSIKIGRVSLEGTGANSFHIAPGCDGKTLADRQSCDIAIRFKPGAVEDYHATLSIMDGEGNQLRSVLLTGTGTEKPIPPGNMDVHPLQVRFVETEVNSSANQQTITVKNTGAGPLSIGAVRLADGNKEDFTLTLTNCLQSPLEAGRECTFQVGFNPKQTGGRTAQLIIPDNAGGSFPVPLSGTGTAAVIEISQSSINFGDRKINSRGGQEQITITNRGSASLKISSLPLNNNREEFFRTNSRCELIPPRGGTCTFTVSFSPTRTGDYSASIAIVSNASNGTQTVSLAGKGVLGPIPSADPPSLNFGTLQIIQRTAVVSQTRELKTSITNKGDVPFVIERVEIKDAGDYKLRGEHSNITINPGGSHSISVIFAPTTEGESKASLIVYTNNAGSLTIPLSGAGKKEVSQPGWCCTKEEGVSQSSERVCRAKKGHFSTNQEKANSDCAKVWCCTVSPPINRIFRSSFFGQQQPPCRAFQTIRIECSGLGRRAFETQEEACRACRPRVNR